MTQSFPSSMLKTSQREVKDAVALEPALITDSDNRHFLFGAKASLTQRLAEIVDDFVYEKRVAKAVRRAEASIARGDYVVGVEEAIAESERMRLARG